jgi:ribosomal protein L14
MSKPRNRCKRCGAVRDVGVTISQRGYCRPCGELVKAENNAAISNKAGEPYQRWLMGWYTGQVSYEQRLTVRDQTSDREHDTPPGG